MKAGDENGQDFRDKVLQLDRILTLIGRKTRARPGHFTQHKLSPPHFVLLRTLKMRGPMRSSDLADQLRVSRGAISNLTDRLHREGFVRRVRSRQDRRVVQVELTAAGSEFLQQKERERITWLSTLFGQIGSSDLDDLLRILRRVVEVMDSDMFNCEPNGKQT